MIQLAFILFVAAAAGGITMTIMQAKGRAVPAFMGKGHGITALVGLIFLFAANLLGEDATSARAWWAFVVLLSGFVGGITVIAQVYRHKPPLWFAAAHGSLGLLGIILLFGPAF